MNASIPGPQGSWLVGNLPEVRADMLGFLSHCRETYGPIAAFRLGHRRVVLISEPKLIEDVLVTKNKQYRKHFATRLLQPVLGEGLLLSEGRKWLKQRRLIQPSFSRKFMQAFSDIVLKHVGLVAQEWKRSSRRDLYQDMTRLTVAIAAHAFLGIDDEREMETVGAALEGIHADYEYRFQRAFTVPLWFPTRRNARLKAAIQQLTDVIDRMISKRQASPNKGNDALSLLLLARDDDDSSMSQQQLRDEVMTLLLAGHDTTANALTWTWTLLAQHPEIAKSLHSEPRGSEISNGEEANKELVDRVVKESMRIFPPVYLFGREAIHTTELGGYKLRRGDSVVISQWVLHRDKLVFENPERFQPERWTAEFEKDLPRYSYLPFGGGPRICIGKDVAMVEATIIVSELASKFAVNLESPELPEPWPTVTLRPRTAVWAEVKALDGSDEAKIDIQSPKTTRIVS